MKLSAALIPVLAASTAFAAADPALLGLAMPGATAVSGVRVDQVESSPFGQYLLSQVPAADPNLDRIIAATGFDPRRDLHEIVAAAAGPGNALVIGRGSFQPGRISSAAILAGATSANYNGVDILTGKRAAAPANGKEAAPGAVAFLDAFTVLLGPVDAVKAAIDRHHAGTTFSGPLAQSAMQVSAGNDAWFVSSSPASFMNGKLPDQNLGNLGNALQAVLQTSGGVKFAPSGVTVSIAAVARSAQDAQSLVDVARFLASLVQVNRDKNPGASKIATLADAATFSASGSVASVSVSLPEAQIEQLLKPDHAGPRTRRVARR